MLETFYYNNCKRDNENDSNSAKWKVVESKFMSMKLRVDQLLTDDRNVEKEFGLIKKVLVVLVVGGTSKNNEILQVLADVFGVQVWRFNATNSASLGAAIKARLAYSMFVNNNRLDININEMLEDGNELVAQFINLL
ncbi:42820_t:CDS:2 [Gigaspora margarita]|uniref:42820_t:CDS:1 n=1 Tax=Gigaspora margarita TaxID=4874 RepID=A0ABN7VLL9_GIGMA|nr:42820_t:CDS:2 [Gigaspora margarita]